MRLFQHTIMIDRPPEAVFDYFTDFEQAPKWRQYVKSMERLDSGPIRAGSRVKVTFTLGGDETVLFMQVLACERASLWRHHTEEKHFWGHIEYRFDVEGTGTRVTMTCVARPITTYGWLGWPLALMSGGRATRDSCRRSSG